MGLSSGRTHYWHRQIIHAARSVWNALLRGKTETRRAAAESLESRQLLSTSWFVSPTGSNQNPGTFAAPFQTIQAAANVAQPGDYVEIEAGTYHETVTPKYSGRSGAPITYQAYDNESVTISGADPISGWTDYSGDIYQASMPWDLGEGNNQVFVDGQAMVEASWPNTSLDPLHPNLATASSVSYHGRSVTIYDSALNQPANYWQGAIIHITPGQAWVAETDTVTSSAPGEITFNFTPTASYASETLPKAGNQFYLTNSFQSLNSPGQWYRDPTTGTLYLETPAGDDPNTHDIEVKSRQYAFNLSGRSYTTIEGVNIFAATICTTTNSFATVIDGIRAAYISQFLSLPELWQSPNDTGILLNGGDNVLENSTISYSAGDGVFVTGPDSHVTNNLINDVDSSASDSAAVRDYAPGSVVENNTISDTGRDGILIEGRGITVEYNNLTDIGLLVTEAGGIYTVNNNGGGTTIAYNTISDMHSGGYGNTALFLDEDSSDFILHDNVVSNVDIALKLNATSEDNKIYNNTLQATQNVVFGDYLGGWWGTVLENNIFIGPVRYGSGAVAKNNADAFGVAGTGAASFTAGSSPDIVDIPIGVPPPPPPPTTPPASTTTGNATTGASEDDSTSGEATASSDIPADLAPAADTTAEISADRSAIATDIAARKATLQQIAATVAADRLAYNAANHQLIAARRKAMHSRTTTITPADVSSLDSQVTQLLAKLKSDELTLATDRRTDFTGIHAARQKLAADLKGHETT